MDAWVLECIAAGTRPEAGMQVTQWCLENKKALRCNCTHKCIAMSPMCWSQNLRLYVIRGNSLWSVKLWHKERPPCLFQIRPHQRLENRWLLASCWLSREILTIMFSLKTSINFERGVITPHTWLTFPSEHLKQLNILWMGRKHVNDFFFFL